MSKKIFVSIPMNWGASENRIRIQQVKVAQAYADYIGDQNVELIDSIVDSDVNALDCLGMSLQLMAKADVIIFSDFEDLKGNIFYWTEARGCRLEYDAAKAYNKAVMYYSGGEITL